MSELAFLSALALARKIRRKDLSSLELLEHYLRRIENFNPRLNAVICMQQEKARKKAREADAAVVRGEKTGPLHGVPMTVKETFDWVGTPSTWGDPIHKNNFPTCNAACVDALISAGAIIFGKTNVPLMLADWQTFNDIYGTTNNPWDLNRVPGGSSGGSAAALAAGMTGLELGSDIGASIRNPAHYCGVFGHKPTYGIVPWQGHALPGVLARSDLAVQGPLARDAGDLAAAMDVLTARGTQQKCGWRIDLPRAGKHKLKHFKAAVMLTSPCCAQDNALTDQLQKAVDSLAKLGTKVSDSARPNLDMRRAHHVYLMLLRAATGTQVADEEYKRSLRSAKNRRPDDWQYRAYVDRGISISHRDWWILHNEREEMRLAWAEFFRKYDLLLCPAAASTAFPHDHMGERADRTIRINGRQEPTTDQLFWAGISSLVYLPATVAPVGLSSAGLPCGIQIVGPHMQDHTCIEFARLLARELGGFAAPPGYD